MSQAPIVLALHFVLELAALTAMAVWAYTTRSGRIRWLLVVALPILAGTLWATFRALGDGPAPPVAIPGGARLALEWAILGGGALLLWRSGRRLPSLLMAGLIVADYALQYDRVARLITS